MSFKGWLSAITFVFIAVILFFARHDLEHAWRLLEQVNLWILALLIPLLLLGYFAGGQIIFSYLRAKNKLGKISPWMLIKLSLELNFVNHVLPSGGVSGFSYMNWRLGKFGVQPGRAAMAQVVRYAVGFMAYIVLLAISVVVVTLDNGVNRWVILMSSGLVSVMVGAIFGGIYLVGSRKRMERFAKFAARLVNKIVRRLTLGRKHSVVSSAKLQLALLEMHDDYIELRRDQSVLKRPFWWSMVFTIADVSVFLVTFWALGHPVNPAPIFIAYGVATTAGMLVITPGGAGVYEAIMVFFLTIAGLPQGLALAGILLTRVILLLSTIGFGYVFYQRALGEYGSNKKPTL